MENVRIINRRGKYNKISDECRNRILRVANNNGDWKLIAEANGVCYKTAHDWLRKGGIPRKNRGGKRQCILKDDDVNVIIEWLEENCQLTLKNICERLRQERGIAISQQSVSKALNGKLICYKQVHYLPQRANVEGNKVMRRRYVENILEYVGELKLVVFVDETNFNLYCRRAMGRARRGARAVVKLPNSKGPNLHIVGCISSSNLEFWERRRGSFKNEDFLDFLRQCLREICANGHNMEDIVLVMDNAPAHSRAESIMEEEEFNGVQICRLAPYSSMLNPIEHIWNSVKAEIKRRLQETFDILIEGDPTGVLNQTEFRIQHLENIADAAMRVVTPQMCLRSFNHVQKHYPSVMQMQDMAPGI